MEQMEGDMLIKLILINYGLCAIITHGKIFDRLRCNIGKRSVRVYELITCMQCTGFWCGLLVSLCYGYGLESILLAFLLSGTNELIDAIIQRIEK